MDNTDRYSAAVVKSINIFLTQPISDLFTRYVVLSFLFDCSVKLETTETCGLTWFEMLVSVFSITELGILYDNYVIPPQQANTQRMRLKMCSNPKVDEGR